MYEPYKLALVVLGAYNFFLAVLFGFAGRPEIVSFPTWFGGVGTLFVTVAGVLTAFEKFHREK